MKVHFSASIPKEIGSPLDNEDFFNIDLEGGRVVVCDGASESFDSRTWGKILGDLFIEDPTISSEWLACAVRRFQEKIDVRSLSWSKQAAYARGSFSTLLGVCECPGGGIDIIGVGDSLFVYLENGEVRLTFPYVHSDSFRNHPTLFSTCLEQNQWLMEEHRSGINTFLPPSRLSDRFVFLMTDALGEWFLKAVEGDDPSWKLLFKIQTINDFEEFILSKRREKIMRMDDSTLMVIQL